MTLFRNILLTVLLLFVFAGGFVFAQVQLGDPCLDKVQCASLGTDAICLGADSNRGIQGSCFISAPQGPQSAGELLQTIELIGEWLFAIFLAISVIFLVWGAFEFVTGEGDPEKVSNAKKRLLYAIIGMTLAFLANGADNVLRSILT